MAELNWKIGIQIKRSRIEAPDQDSEWIFLLILHSESSTVIFHIFPTNVQKGGGGGLTRVFRGI